MTAATMFMDVVTNFAPSGAKAFTPTQADRLERGPVRLRSALQFSLNVPAIKAGFINGLDHQFQRTKDFGLTYPKGTTAVASESIGTLGVHPIDMISAFGVIGNGGVLMPHHTILKVIGPDGTQVWPRPGAARPREAGGLGPGGVHHHRHPGGEHGQVHQPVLGQVADHERPQQLHGPPGGVQDRHHQRQPRRAGLRLPRPALGQEAARPSSRASGWATRTTRPTTASCPSTPRRRSGSAILSEVSKGMKIEGFARVRPKGLVTEDGRCVHRDAAGADHDEDRQGAVPARHGAHPGGRQRRRRGRGRGQRPALAGGLRRARW